jgi:hypothetical protein
MLMALMHPPGHPRGGFGSRPPPEPGLPGFLPGNCGDCGAQAIHPGPSYQLTNPGLNPQSKPGNQDQPNIASYIHPP